ncbi:putative pheromone processing carboxypeptidase [Geranomyces variabilis]|nr:putative pheromone processing carboxypeptidase [Geranomyces variabilis]KAJ3133722.1 hypothetical protein HDU90_005560 [Geranomyces variabilis]
MHLPVLVVAFAACASAVRASSSFLKHRKAARNIRGQNDNPLARRADVADVGKLPEIVPAATAPKPKYLNAKTLKYSVNGRKIPDVNFDVGESYAGLMPISASPKESRQLYFWFFPTANTEKQDNVGADDEILIWLNGGPGCSSLEGLFQEKWPVSMAVRNSWHRITNVVWVEQPVSTGFSQGTATAKSSADAAWQFGGFWENFMKTFDLQGKKIYIIGESYAGTSIPYIADYMIARKDNSLYNFLGSMLYDPLIGEHHVQDIIPAARCVDKWKDLFGLNDTFMATIQKKAHKRGYTDYMNKYLVFPPAGPQPTVPVDPAPGCDVWMDIFEAVLLINPCFDIYQIATTCPLLWDNLGFPGSQEYLPDGAHVYFDRADVKKAIKAPNVSWNTCSVENVFVGYENGADLARSPIFGVLPRVINHSDRTVIAHGQLDFVLIEDGTLLAIQNMTWKGHMGFGKPPVEPFLVPYHPDGPLGALAGAGVFGTAHTERGLTYSSVKLAGHMVPQYAPSAAYRQVQYLLGRIDSLNKV